jgi:3-oxoacyl-[acyl-carrier-protein] synthase II
MRRVVITGVGIVSPLGLTADEHWRRLLAGETGVGPATAFDASGFTCHNLGEVPPFKPTDSVPRSYRKATKIMSRDIELAVLAARDAFATAGLKSRADEDGPDFDPARFGCNIGAGLISADLKELGVAMNAARDEVDPAKIDWKAWGERGLDRLTPLWMLKYLPNMLASHVTIVHGLTGPSNNITCGEASGHLSVGEAVRAIRRGTCDLAIAGGCESQANPMAAMRQQLLERTSPTGTVRPFSKDADGSVPAEGGALLIVEERERAIGRGATIYAEVAGFGSTQDTFDHALPDPAGAAYSAACRAALREAKSDAADVQAIFPHGLGIPAHDRSELAGLRGLFGDKLRDVACCPTKHATGSTAAGCAIDLAVAALAVHHQTLPPAPQSDEPIDDDLQLAVTSREQPVDLAVAPIFGAGGQNAAVVLRRHA